MAIPFRATFATADVAAVCALQTTAGAASLVINGTQIANTYPPSAPSVTFVNVERPLTYTSTADLHLANITAVGEDLKGNAVTETRSGPTSNTVATTALFHKVISLTTDAALATAMSVGSGTTGRTAWFKVNRWAAPTGIGINAAITATLNFTLQYTYDSVETVASPVALSEPFMTSITASAETTFNDPVNAIRGLVNSSSGSGAVTLNIIQGTGGV